MLPFTAEQFFGVFERYNTDLPFAVAALNVLAIVAVVFACVDRIRRPRVPVLILGILWLWSGAVYQIAYFASINPAANVFGVAFVVQAALFAFAGFRKGGLPLEFRSDHYGYAGAALVLYSLVLYPLTAYIAGHVFPRTPSFGLPCPLTIFTFGLLLWSRRTVPAYLLIVPAGWTIIGTSAAVLFGVWEDLALLVAGFTAIALIIRRRTQE